MIKSKVALILCASLAIPLISPAQDSVPNENATGITHFLAQAQFMVPDSTAPVTATGNAKISRKYQGSGDHQTLDMRFQKMDSTLTYVAKALVGSDWVQLTEFKPDTDGKATVSFRNSEKTSSRWQAFPNAIIDVTRIDRVAIFIRGEISPNPLLVANFLQPADFETFQRGFVYNYNYSKRLLTLGYLRVQAEDAGATINLQIFGLLPGEQYVMVLGDTKLQTVTADADGTVSFGVALESPDAVLNNDWLWIKQVTLEGDKERFALQL